MTTAQVLANSASMWHTSSAEVTLMHMHNHYAVVAGGTVSAHKAAPLSLGPLLFAPLVEDVAQAALGNNTASDTGWCVGRGG